MGRTQNGELKHPEDTAVLSTRFVQAATGLALLTIAVRLVPAWFLQSDNVDIMSYRVMAETVLRGDNIYAPRILFPYSPFSQFLPAFLMQLSGLTGLQFDFVAKLPAILADAGTALLLFGYLNWRHGSLREALLWSLGWAINPIAILISAFHGNLMAVVPLLVVGALVAAELAEVDPNRDLLVATAALLLGLAIAFRTFPILLFPVFLLLFTRTFTEAALFTTLSALPSGLSALPYLLYARQTFLAEVLTYSGSTDFGWVSVLRSAAFLTRGERIINMDAALIDLTKRLYVVGFVLVVLLLPFFRREALGRALLLAPLLFYGLYAGVSAQYLDWALPIALLLRAPIVVPYSLFGTAALTGFYLTYHPAVLFGRYSPLLEISPTVVGTYATANALLVLLALGWTIHIVATEIHAYRHAYRKGISPPPVLWLQQFRPIWSSRFYLGALAIVGLVWLQYLGLTALRVRDLAPGLLGL